MDLSKLPRLSKTEPPGPTEPSAAAAAPAGARGAFCDQCGAALRAGAKFCDSCGAPLASASAASPAMSRNAPSNPAAPQPGDGAGMVVEVWMSLILGILFLFLGRPFLSHPMYHPSPTGIVWSPGHPKAGQDVPPEELNPELRKQYDDRIGSERLGRQSQAAMALFGIVLLIDAGVRLFVLLTPLPGRRTMMSVALLCTICVLLFNMLVAYRHWRAGIIPIYSLLCIAVGGYVAFAQWMTLQTIGSPRTRTASVTLS